MPRVYVLCIHNNFESDGLLFHKFFSCYKKYYKRWALNIKDRMIIVSFDFLASLSNLQTSVTAYINEQTVTYQIDVLTKSQIYSR